MRLVFAFFCVRAFVVPASRSRPRWRAAATIGDVAPLARDVACSSAAVVGAVGWLKVWTSLAAAGAIDSRLSRKIIHCGSAPLFLLVWPLYSDAATARLVAAVVPLLNLARLVAAGRGTDSRLVTAVSRSGEAKEVLGGPLIYCVVLLAASLFGWRVEPAAVVAVTQMAVGDGLADIIGRRFGQRHKWPFAPDKSYAGSLAFVLGGFAATVCLLRWFEVAHCFAFVRPWPEIAAIVLFISLACALVELVPVADDNISVPVVGALLASLLLDTTIPS